MNRDEESTAVVREGTLRLRDGRQMAYLDLGPPTGLPLLCCHGTPGSRLEFRSAAPHAAALGTRLIAPDRPGYGGSDFRRGSLLDWADDGAALLDALGLPRAAVLGVSGGVEYALALAYRYPGRVRRLGV